MFDCPYKVPDLISGLTSNLGYHRLMNRTASNMARLHSSGILTSKKKIKNPFKSIETKLKKKIIDKLNMSSILNTHLCNIVAYPDSDVNELYTIMTQFGISRIPVASNPWNRKLIGFIDLETLENVLSEV